LGEVGRGIRLAVGGLGEVEIETKRRMFGGRCFEAQVERTLLAVLVASLLAAVVPLGQVQVAVAVEERKVETVH
jgi:hypothetical protein